MRLRLRNGDEYGSIFLFSYLRYISKFGSMGVGLNLRYLGGISGDVGAYFWLGLLLVGCCCVYMFLQSVDGLYMGAVHRRSLSFA